MQFCDSMYLEPDYILTYTLLQSLFILFTFNKGPKYLTCVGWYCVKVNMKLKGKSENKNGSGELNQKVPSSSPLHKWRCEQGTVATCYVSKVFRY